MSDGRTRAKQLAMVVALELRKVLISRRALPLYVLAALPVVPPLLRAIFAPLTPAALPKSIAVYSMLFQTLLLRLVLFLGCFVVFTNLFRGDLRDRTLHFYFLSPVRRELIVAGKYVAGVIGGAALFAGSTIASYAAMVLPFGPSALAERAGQLAAYVLVAVLGVAGYGAVFLLLGTFARNGMIPAAIIWAWEFANPIVPAVLKQISVIHYLTSLVPVHPDEGPFALIAEPTPWFVSVPGVLVLTGIVLRLAAWRTRRMEIAYGTE